MNEIRNEGMLGGLIRFCMENKLVVGLTMLFAACAGLAVAPFDWDLGGLPRDPVPVDAIPDLGENQQIVFTKWPGFSPQDIQDQVTYPLTVALLGIPKVKTIRSSSMFGFSSIYVVFEEGVDFYWGRTRILEKLASLPPGELPQGVRPVLGPDATALGQVFWYVLEGSDAKGNPVGGWGLEELRALQDWTVRYALMAAGGVSEVASIGGYVKEYQVDMDPDAMRADGVSQAQVFKAVQAANVDVGARTVEVNRVEYVVRGLGLIKNLDDIRETVVAVHDGVPIRIKDVAEVTLGPAPRRGALDEGGIEKVGGVVVARFGANPLQTIKNVKKKLDEFARRPDPDRDVWVMPVKKDDGTPGYVRLVPFYDRTGLIYETLGTLRTALTDEILVTVLVVLVMVLHLRSALLISGLLPLAVLMCFSAMKLFGVDANIVALSGIAIAVGTMVDMGIVLCENMLKRLEEAAPDESRLEVLHRAATEVAGAVLTAVATTVVGFLPVFTMTAAEGKLFKPLAYTKTFALIASVIVAVVVLPPAAHILFAGRLKRAWLRRALDVLLCGAGLAVGFLTVWWLGALLVALAVYRLAEERLPEKISRHAPAVINGVVVLLAALLLAEHWSPLGPEQGEWRNFFFVALVVGGVLGLFQLFQRAYPYLLRRCLDHKVLFLSLPTLLVLFGAYVWLGPATLFGPLKKADAAVFGNAATVKKLVEARLLERRGKTLLWTTGALSRDGGTMRETLTQVLAAPTTPTTPAALAVPGKVGGKKSRAGTVEAIMRDWAKVAEYSNLRSLKWKDVKEEPPAIRLKWTLARDWDGRGREFMPPLDEGSFLFMPVTMPHASIGECLDVIKKLDEAIASVPEVAEAVGKIGRVDSALDPAPLSMVETVVNYKPEYVTGKDGRRLRFKYDEGQKHFVRDAAGKLLPDPAGRPFRNWRPNIRTADDIWKEIVRVARLPGTTSASKLQPIAARLVMLQSGMRAPMGVKVKGEDLKTIEKVGLEIEKLLKDVSGVRPEAVVADRIIGKPYLEIVINRRALQRYKGLSVRRVQKAIETAIGGRRATTTLEGRERWAVRVRQLRELRDSPEALGEILVADDDGAQIPLAELTDIRYVRGPQNIKSEDTFLTGYVLFDKKDGYAETDVVEECRRRLDAEAQKFERAQAEAVAKKGGALTEAEIASLPGLNLRGCKYTFAGTYENQIRSQRTLAVVLPAALFVIFLILYLQFRSVPTSLLVFSGVFIAFSGGFLMLWLYAQPWFLNFSLFGENLRTLFQIHPFNLSVAVWVGFLALFGIATDDGVILATYLGQSFAARQPQTPEEVRAATVEAGRRRIRPCLMTVATTILALLPVLTSTGRGADVMIPMAVPSFGGMTVVLISVFVVPTLYCALEELKLRAGKTTG